MKISLLVLCSVAACRSDLQEEWSNFKDTYKKGYADPYEEQVRMKIFIENKAVIDEHNEKYKKGLVSFEMGMNHFGDMTQEEFEKAMLGVEEETGYDEDTEQETEKSFFSKEIQNRTGEASDSTTTHEETQQTTEEPDDHWSINRLKRSLDSENFINSVKNSNFTKFVSFIWTLLNISKKKNSTVETIDWVKAGAVTPVRDQGQCGSCWAFSATGALESHIYLKTGKLVPLSIQNLVDCTKTQPYDNLGCQGGIMTAAFEYAKDHGLATEQSYPYETKDSTCRYEKKLMNATCRGYAHVVGENAIMDALRNKGPVSVVLDATTIQFRFYKKGLYEGTACSYAENSNHAVLAVGYGSMGGKGYWLVKNSWGPDWGEEGFFKINRQLACGINFYGVYPIV